MRVEVDSQRCQGHALCVLVAPEVFTTDAEQGQSISLQGEIPPHLLAKAEAAVAGCPERALSVVADS